jgi:protein-disulfide isomerase
VLPTVIQRYVRSGKLRLVFRPLAFLGADSEPAAKAALAAGQQDRLWQYADAFYRNQGPENGGYVTDAFLRKVGSEVPGLDVAKLMSDMNSSSIATKLQQIGALADKLKVNGTPSFFISRNGGAPQPLQVSQLTSAEFTSALDQALGSG